MTRLKYFAPAHAGAPGPKKVWVIDENGQKVELMHIERHSPDGFQWGYGGSGPADLALSIMVHHLNVTCGFTWDRAVQEADCWYQAFKREFLVGIGDQDQLDISSARISEWFTAKKREAQS
jgi:hypothetical protein